MTQFSLDRRGVLIGAMAGAAFGGAAAAQTPRRITVYKTPWCDCCGGWVDHMRQAGWTAQVIERDDLAPIRASHGIADRLASCHTAVVGRYAIEGHVPTADVARLLRERPDARALTVPGMPIGSPGMEGDRREPFSSLLILADGSTGVFARHNAA